MERFTHCFCKGYWKCAASELKNLRSLALCAVIAALRIALKLVEIPVVPPYLYITFGYVVNSLGAAIYGPFLALVGGAVSDTVGALVFPKGTYFFPYIFVEMASGFLFALFLYRARFGAYRIILSRFTVVAVCNLLMNPVVNYFYFLLILGKNYTKAMVLSAVIKNAAMFPVECLILVLFLGGIARPLAKAGLLCPTNGKIKMTAGTVVLLVGLTLLAIGAIFLYIVYKGIV